MVFDNDFRGINHYNYYARLAQARTDLLSSLAEFLDTIDSDSFNMGIWESYCGTVACAIGHACRLIPWQRAGLSMITTHDSGRMPYCFGSLDIEAVMKVTGLTKYISRHLFLQQSYVEEFEILYIQPNMVSERIRRVISYIEMIRFEVQSGRA